MTTADKLAVQRTKLANERTFLSYIRTCLVCFAGGTTLLKFYPTDKYFTSLSLFLLFSGLIIIVTGAFRYFKTGHYLSVVKPEDTGSLAD